jgi:hypothetical protein
MWSLLLELAPLAILLFILWRVWPKDDHEDPDQ